jgi:multisubunit Na+/H+ antiporter MnhB subunit
MQGIRRLPQMAETPESSRNGASYGGVAAGLAILALAILGAGGTVMYRAQNYRPVFVGMEHMSPTDTWFMWQELKEGVQFLEYAESDYQKARRIYRQYMAIGWAIIIVGGLLLASAGVIALRGRSAGRRELSRGAS